MSAALEKATKDLHDGYDMLCKTDDEFSRYTISKTVYANTKSREFYIFDERGRAFEVTVKRATRYDRD